MSSDDHQQSAGLQSIHSTNSDTRIDIPIHFDFGSVINQNNHNNNLPMNLPPPRSPPTSPVLVSTLQQRNSFDSVNNNVNFDYPLSNLMRSHFEWRSRFQNVIRPMFVRQQSNRYVPIHTDEPPNHNHHHHHHHHHRLSDAEVRARDTNSSTSTTNINSRHNNNNNNNGIYNGNTGVNSSGSNSSDATDIEDTSGVSEVIANLPEARLFFNLTYRYVPFLAILLIKLFYDHLNGILQILFLACLFLRANKIFKEQIIAQQQGSSSGNNSNNIGITINAVSLPSFLRSRFDQKPIFILLREAAFILIVIILYFLFILDPLDKNKLGFFLFNPNLAELNKLNLLLYYVLITDLLLKLITILIKVFITTLPQTIVKIKKRGRLYAAIERFSQLYRSMVPMQPWILYLLYSYPGMEKILGVIFSSLYMGWKGFDIYARIKFFIKSFQNVMKSVNYGRQAIDDEVSGTCPICHDDFDTPVVLECTHIFCENCVGTWFTKENTCPLCRIKIADDPSYQDGSTTLFVQFF